MDAVFAIADRITVLVGGRVIASGGPEEIRSDPEVRRAYLGEDFPESGDEKRGRTRARELEPAVNPSAINSDG